MWKIAGIGLLLLAGQAYGSENIGCKARQQAVTDQLAFARAHNNQEQVAGLERALRNLEAHCTDAGLLEEQQRKVVLQHPASAFDVVVLHVCSLAWDCLDRDADGNELLGNRAVETTHAIKDAEIYVI